MFTTSDTILSAYISGLAFHEDLTTPVILAEAETFAEIVRTEAERILPGVITTLVGGFRR
jgi:hypothetical protein